MTSFELIERVHGVLASGYSEERRMAEMLKKAMDDLRDKVQTSINVVTVRTDSEEHIAITGLTQITYVELVELFQQAGLEIDRRDSLVIDENGMRMVPRSKKDGSGDGNG